MTSFWENEKKEHEWMKPDYFKNRPWEERLEEYADLHGENCSCMMEQPDECDCDEMEQIKGFINEIISKKDAEWGKKVEKLKQPGLSIEDREILLARLALAEKMAEALKYIYDQIDDEDDPSANPFKWIKDSCEQALDLWEQGKKD